MSELLDRYKNHVMVVFILLVSLLLRVYLSQFDGYKIDVMDFKIWSRAVYYIGIPDFYSSVWCDYPPFYLYILWIVGACYKLFSPTFDIDTELFTILIKAPANIADLATALLIFLIVKKKFGFKTAYFSMLCYAFNPAIIYNSAIWGQADAVNTLFILLALMLIEMNRLELAGVSMAIAILTKSQSLVILPLIAILMIKKASTGFLLSDAPPFLFSPASSMSRSDTTLPVLYKTAFRLVKIFIISTLVFIALALPFYLKTSPLQLIEKYTSGYSQYAYNSLNAFNFWAFLGFWKPDDSTFLFLSYKIWGYLLFSLLFVYVAYSANKKGSIYSASAVIFFGFFMLFTRVHERYLFPMFAPLAIAARLDKRLNSVFLIMTFTFLFNLHYVLQFLNSNEFISDGDPFVLLASGINAIVFIYTVYCLSNHKAKIPEGL